VVFNVIVFVLQRVAKARQHAVRASISQQAFGHSSSSSSGGGAGGILGGGGVGSSALTQSEAQIQDLKQSVKQQVEACNDLKQQLATRELELRETKFELNRLQTQVANTHTQHEQTTATMNRKAEMKYKQDLTSLRTALEKVEMQGKWYLFGRL
jgi:multidrug resistance efflux pump